MSEYRIPCTPSSAGYRQECDALRQTEQSMESIEDWLSTLALKARIACRLPHGYIKKIVWDEAGGYPPHAWGYIQYSPRPYVQGYGCDGTTDNNIHLIGITLCQHLNLDYYALHREAYPKEGSQSDTDHWTTTLLHDQSLREETLLPQQLTLDALRLLLSDLYQINNRSFVDVLEQAFHDCGYDVSDWHTHEDRLRPAWLKE